MTSISYKADIDEKWRPASVENSTLSITEDLENGPEAKAPIPDRPTGFKVYSSPRATQLT